MIFFSFLDVPAPDWLFIISMHFHLIYILTYKKDSWYAAGAWC